MKQLEYPTLTTIRFNNNGKYIVTGHNLECDLTKAKPYIKPIMDKIIFDIKMKLERDTGREVKYIEGVVFYSEWTNYLTFNGDIHFMQGNKISRHVNFNSHYEEDFINLLVELSRIPDVCDFNPKYKVGDYVSVIEPITQEEIHPPNKIIEVMKMKDGYSYRLMGNVHTLPEDMLKLSNEGQDIK